MSDILIKNMEMPETCADCNFSTWNGFESVYCDVNAEFIPRKEWKEKRQNWCLLNEIHTPHGRLIDADRLVRELKNIMSEEDPRFAELMYIVGQPTVIEAEGT